jgi:fatty acid desaturase
MNDQDKVIRRQRGTTLHEGGISHPSCKALGPRIRTNEYVELKSVIKKQKLLDRQPAYYTCKILLTLSMLALSLTFLLITDSFWLQLLNAAYLAFVSTQLAFIGHDAGHRQIFQSARKSDLLGLISSPISYSA